jgi:hypothetical protein
MNTQINFNLPENTYISKFRKNGLMDSHCGLAEEYFENKRKPKRSLVCP